VDSWHHDCRRSPFVGVQFRVRIWNYPRLYPREMDGTDVGSRLFACDKSRDFVLAGERRKGNFYICGACARHSHFMCGIHTAVVRRIGCGTIIHFRFYRRDEFRSLFVGTNLAEIGLVN